MRDFTDSNAHRRTHWPAILRPLAMGGSALVRITGTLLTAPARSAHRAPKSRIIDRMTAEQLSYQLGMTVLAGHPDHKALNPYLKAMIRDWQAHDWDRIGQTLARLDRTHAALPGGDRIAPALGRTLFRHIAGPDLCAAMDRGESLSPDDLPDRFLIPLSRVLDHPKTDPALHFLAAQLHLELGWARHGDDNVEYTPDGKRSAAEVCFDTASALLDRIAPRAPHSGYFAEIDYRTRAAQGTTQDALNRAAIRWSRADPGSLVPYATHGLHLLPRWYGDDHSLRDFANKSWAKTNEALGAATYAAAYLTALEYDLDAGLSIDMDVFRSGLIDMMDECEDPDLICNVVLRTLWELSAAPYTDSPRQPKALRDLRRNLRRLFCDLTRTTLGPIMPEAWGGRWTEAKIMRALAEAFAAEIAAGKAIAIGLDGAQILD